MRVYLQLTESFSDVSFQIYRGDLAATLAVSWASVLFWRSLCPCLACYTMDKISCRCLHWIDTAHSISPHTIRRGRMRVKQQGQQPIPLSP